MPSIHRRPGRRTFYLDTSTLSYAFRGATEFRYQDDPAEFAELRVEVERIAREDNLCVSLMHVKELAQWPDLRAANALIDWLDALDTVWTYGADQVVALEDERGLQLAVGITEPASVDVFAPSMTAAFRKLKINEFTEALEGGGRVLHKLFDAARKLGGERERTMMSRMQARFHFDRHQDPQTRVMTPDEKRAVVAAKLRADLERDAIEARERLRGRDLPDFHARCRAVRDLSTVCADFVLANPTSLPAFHIGTEFNSRFADVFARRKPGGKGAKEFDSSFYDWAHLVVGAAYCDVFTCDVLVRDCLAGAREALGYGSPIAYANNDAIGFVAALRTA